MGTRQGEVANARADLSSTEALIGRLKLEIEKLRRQLYGTRSQQILGRNGPARLSN
jgi:hypothetical protein